MPRIGPGTSSKRDPSTDARGPSTEADSVGGPDAVAPGRVELDHETRRLLKRAVSQKRFTRLVDDIRPPSPPVPTLYERVLEYELGAQIMHRLLVAYPREPNLRAHAMIAADILLWLESIGVPFKELPKARRVQPQAQLWPREATDPRDSSRGTALR